MFRPISDIRNSTGLVFGFPGAPLLTVAVERAARAGKVAIISAINLAATREVAEQENVIGAVQVGNQEELGKLIVQLNGSTEQKFDAVVFHGLAEYAQIALNFITSGTPTQSEWGEMARGVANQLRQLQNLAPVVYVTCDAVYDDDGKPRLNINPGLQKLILGDLVEKLFVYKQSGENGAEIVVQDDPVAALAFQRVKRERPTSEASADGSARRMGGGSRERRLR